MTLTPAPGPTPPARRGVGRNLLIVLSVVAVVCCGGTVAAGVALYRGFGAAVGPPRDAANRFLSDVESGDTAGAYGLLCDTVRAHLTQPSFADLLAGQGHLASHMVVN